jgi:hypothetical protein
VDNPDATSPSHPATDGGAEGPTGGSEAPPAVDTAVDPPSTSSVPPQAGPADTAFVAPPAAVSAASPAAPSPSSTAYPASSGAGPPYPAGHRPYPPYLPARRSRHRLAVPILVAAIVIALVATVGVGVARPTKPQGHGSLGSVSVGAAGTRSGASLSSVLNAQSGALIDGDEAAFLVAVDASATSAVAAYKRMYANLRAASSAMG